MIFVLIVGVICVATGTFLIGYAVGAERTERGALLEPPERRYTYERTLEPPEL